MTNHNFIVDINTLEDTNRIGQFLGSNCLVGDVICLTGDLGAGKTTLTQCLAKGLKVDEKQYVTSPSFAIMHQYQGRIPLYHMDLYRLGGEDEVIDLGFEEIFYGDGLTVIEWPERAGSLIPDTALWIVFNLIDDNKRVLEFKYPATSHWANNLDNFKR